MPRKKPPSSDLPFNPYHNKTISIPLAVLRYPSLSHGAKLLYGRLMLFRGRNAERFCAPAVKRLGVEMGVAIRIVERWIAELVDQAFIERRRRGSGRPAECIFLRHPAFDADPPILADHTVPDPPDMAGQDEVLIRHSCRTHPPEMADVDPPNPADAYKEEKESVLKGI